ncbi:MLP-like protein 28 [Morus notabilis]|uniref:MLP-like protein 28 n=1 Tax=Morus notabilis TaxID=981085 RepID=W9REG3_9ROSA|nr:MLP-like protein 28 [Morus notabilis]
MSSDLCGKLETDVEIKAFPSQFHHMFKHKPHHISNVSSGKIQGCDLHEGEWGTVGAVIYWNYFHGKMVIFTVIEGDLMEHFTGFLSLFKQIPKSVFVADVSKDLETHILEDHVFGKLETDVEIKASPSKFHHMFRHKPHHISNVSSDKIQGYDLQEGEWGTVGAVIYWNYFHVQSLSFSLFDMQNKQNKARGWGCRCGAGYTHSDAQIS